MMLNQQNVVKNFLKNRNQLSKLEYTQNNYKNFTFQVSRHSYKKLYWKNEAEVFLFSRYKCLLSQVDRNKDIF